ncbi:MAG: magnesium transporter CorA family protein [Tissierellales bacterium]|nr:magnesium transporter CorA family protein [Tissierellales bacterium]
MMKIYKTVESDLIKLDHIEEKSWISLINPTLEELKNIEETLEVEMDFLKAPLDDEETSRIEIEDEQIFILVDIPVIEEEDGSIEYGTLPFGIILKDKYIITICLKDNIVLNDFRNQKIKNFFTFKRNRFVLQMLYRIDTKYLIYLKQIDRMSNQIERQLHQSMKNKELIQLLDLEKSLVYFTTSLRGNQLVLEKLGKLKAMKLYPEDEDLLEDVIIENKQAIEMANIYSSILSGMMDAFASVISNNLNIVMKYLTTITIVMSIPTIFASFYGMNVPLPLQNSPYMFWGIFTMALAVALIAGKFLNSKKMF